MRDKTAPCGGATLGTGLPGKPGDLFGSIPSHLPGSIAEIDDIDRPEGQMTAFTQGTIATKPSQPIMLTASASGCRRANREPAGPA
jgi:hypothetical protein